MKRDKKRAVEVLSENASGGRHTYGEICEQTGYERKRVGRLARAIAEWLETHPL